ncbi:hypothetical protein Syun_024573 [Stephania yunnanensis]|uniref:E2 ubiquitin-conjugating enzyme n=1 Tax=Stephania yunnanensis TaxID=152371 RepID=A0AAP0NHK8_9MAGN
MLDLTRVQKELTDCNRDKLVSGVSLSLRGDDLAHLSGTISGPIGTPYEGGTFEIDIRIPDDYPFVPPKMKFVTKVWHPNISSQNGAICLDILKDQWSPALTVKTAMLSLQALLSTPEPNDPQDAVVAQQVLPSWNLSLQFQRHYIREYPTFVNTARYWTEAFAKRTSIGTEEKVKKLVEMGFPENSARKALDTVGGDENLALEKLCSG